MIPEFLREMVDLHHAAMDTHWRPWEERFGGNGDVKHRRIELASPAPAERPKKDIQPAFQEFRSERHNRRRVGLQTGKKAMPVAHRVMTPEDEKKAKALLRSKTIIPQNPATCRHEQDGRSTWKKNGMSSGTKHPDGTRIGAYQQMQCQACLRISKMMDGVVLDPGPYVPRLVPCPPADLPGFMRAFLVPHGVTLNDVLGTARPQPLCDARRALACELADRFHMSQRAIAAAMNKDQNSITYWLATRVKSGQRPEDDRRRMKHDDER